MSSSTVLYPRRAVRAAFDRAYWLVDAYADSPEPGEMTGLAWELLGLGTWISAGCASQALNAACEQVTEEGNPEGGETADTIRLNDALNLAVNCAMYFLDHPAATLDEAIPAQYEGVEPDFDLGTGEDGGHGPDCTPAPVPGRGSAGWNEAVTTTVLSWLS